MTSKVRNDFSEAHFDMISCFFQLLVMSIWSCHMAEPNGNAIWQSHMALPYGIAIWQGHMALHIYPKIQKVREKIWGVTKTKSCWKLCKKLWVNLV